MDLFAGGAPATSYMIVTIPEGEDEPIRQLRLKISGGVDQGPPLIPNPEEGTVAVWRSHILLASSSTLYHYDLTEQFRRMEGKPGSDVVTLELENADFHAVAMKADWSIKGIQEADEPGECTLICEDDADSALIFFKINGVQPGAEDFQAMDSAAQDNRRAGGQDEDAITSYRSLLVR